MATTLLNKLKPFSEWHDMDDRLSRAIHESGKRQEATATSQGRAFIGFVGRQPEVVQSSLNRINGLLKQAAAPFNTADDAIPKVRAALAPLRSLQDGIKAKRKSAQALRDKAAKSAKRAETAQARLEALKAKNPSSPEMTKLQSDAARAANQKDADSEALEKGETVAAADEREYKRAMFLAVIGALEQFGSARIAAGVELAPIGEELAEAGAGIPGIEDPRAVDVQSQLQALREESLA
jgi:hypothetical protein